jgi:hypothetical protein
MSDLCLEKGTVILYRMALCLITIENPIEDNDIYKMISLNDMFELAKQKVYYSMSDVEKKFLELIETS